MAQAKHRLVVVGDSLSQGFMSGAIYRTDLSYPAMVATALGVGGRFRVPEFYGAGGLPLNLELLLRRVGEQYGSTVDWYELGPALWTLREWLDDVEDYWERGRGARAVSDPYPYHNLSVWGFEVADAYTITEGLCRRALPRPHDDAFSQIPEMPMYRTARRVLNPSFGAEGMEQHQMQLLEQIAADGGIENLVVFLGANNALGTVTSLSVRYSEPPDLHRPAHERRANLYLPEHFQALYAELVRWIEKAGATHVFLGTVPKVTIPPVTRGVSPEGSLVDGYFEYYTRPWVWDPDFRPDRHPHLTREQAQQIDAFIESYNQIIHDTASAKGWHVFDVCRELDQLAYRRNVGSPKYEFPVGLVQALRANPELSYLVDERERVQLDTRFFCTRKDGSGRVREGGIVSLDGVHPTTIGYGLLADLLVRKMREVGVSPVADLDWPAIVRRDTLINTPPRVLSQLQDTLRFLDRQAVLSMILEHFS